ncbi:class I SAM-dependent methyltransferase [Nonomuraea sp. NPDC049480]|uniref:class I SAM-dependent methyltransferase n=1 Tax=Nonomuraea sp. NPDC049480 TaxID=3364353 RepID=UPI0037B13EE8
MDTGHNLFIREFLRNPLRTASVIPSSRRVARHMAAALPEEGDPVVVELGPGTGAFTTEIQRRLHGRGRHLAVELNDRFAALLRDRFPAVDVVVSDALHVRRLLDQQGWERADAIISGLPHALFSQTLQHRLMSAVRDCLAPDGTFAAFAYVHAAWSPPARRFCRLLEAVFGEVAVGKIVWANLPPAYVYTARHIKSRPHAGVAGASRRGALKP